MAVQWHPAHRLLAGRLAGMLFLVGALASVPVNRLFEPAVPGRSTVVTVVGVLSGIICLTLPWQRLPAWSVHVIPPLASFEVALTMWGVGEHAHAYVWFLVLIAVFVAHAFTDRRAIAAHGAFALAVVALPYAWTKDPGNYTAQALVAIPVLLTACGVVVWLREQLEARQGELAAEARLDPLTGAGNRRLLDERLDYELARHRRTQRPLALIVLDLDRFKEVNDRLGHLAGDDLLREVANRLRATVRDGDTVVRHGGDELAVLAPETGRDEARMLVRRIERALSDMVVLGRPLSASAGVAVFPEDGPSPALLLAHADLQERERKAVASASWHRSRSAVSTN